MARAARFTSDGSLLARSRFALVQAQRAPQIQIPGMVKLRAVLIVGAGPAGLSLAVALRQHGLPAVLVEREPQWQSHGDAIALQGNAMRVLRALGMADAVVAAGAPLSAWVLSDVAGTTTCELDLARVWTSVDTSVCITRRALHQILVAGAAGVPCRLGTVVRSLEAVPAGVRACFSDGTAGTYDLVVAADGLYSGIRRLAGGSRPTGASSAPDLPLYAGQMVWRSLAKVTIGGLRGVRFALGDGRFFGLVSAGDGYTYGFGNITGPRRRDPRAGRLSRLRADFAHFDGLVQDYLRALHHDEQVHCSAIHVLPASVWRAGLAQLVGDAAHGCSPMLAQGTAMCLEDSWLLAQLLSTHTDLDAALDAFQQRREPRVRWVREQSAAVAAALARPPALRDASLRAGGAALLAARFEPLRADP
jgi:2-polyprenyl-6-methoxyphenol hydroxylase-like FAD-dependent oxidoreductase